MTFQYFEASGTPYELGRSHGEQARDLIHAFVDHVIRTSGRSRAEVSEAALQYLPLFQRHCPELLQEVHGLAEGAGLTLAEALLPQIRGEIQGVLPERACTTFAVDGSRSATGGVLIGQTSDMAPEWEQYFIVLRLCPAQGPRVLMWTFAGQLGYHGLNEYGVAHFANSLSGGPPPERVPGGLPHYPVKRLLYECRTRDEVMERWHTLPVCSSGNYMIATSDPAIFDVEVTPTGTGVLEAQDGLLAHANHFLSARYRTPETDRQSIPDSFARQERMLGLLRGCKSPITVDQLKRFAADHSGHPQSVCRHEAPAASGMVTVAALIAEPIAGILHVVRGQPCRGNWTAYSVW